MTKRHMRQPVPDASATDDSTLETVQIADLDTSIAEAVRADLRRSVAGGYADQISAGAELPPPTAFRVGDQLMLVDGRHTIEAHRELGHTEVLVRLHPGTVDEAQRFALGSNNTHGLQRSGADKRRLVQYAFEHFGPEVSDNQIAAICRLSQTFVSRVARECGRSAQPHRGADGVLRRPRSAPNRAGGDAPARSGKAPTSAQTCTTPEQEVEPRGRRSCSNEAPESPAAVPEVDEERLSRATSHSLLFVHPLNESYLVRGLVSARNALARLPRGKTVSDAFTRDVDQSDADLQRLIALSLPWLEGAILDAEARGERKNDPPSPRGWAGRPR